MSKVLGLDLGTNSIGWAIVNRTENGITLLDHNVHIFQEGVNRVKGNEEPTVKKRTEARASRRHYFRRRLRKIELLKILIDEKWCPYLSEASLAEWRQHKLFPLDPDFIAWLRTDELNEKNPYHDRHRCLNETLDLSTREDRFCLGRALYHINQRRGFLSNRKDQQSDAEDGKVKTAISNLDDDMKKAGYEYLGDYYYHLYNSGEKIRKHYTDRNNHYIKEFYAICSKQGLSQDLTEKLYRAIFYQRPLKSQKGLVGKCPFERGKSRCAVSHPDFERYRMLSFINNIRIAMPGEIEMRPLSPEEKDTIFPLFYRKSKDSFDFSDITKKLAGKNVKPVYANKEDSCDINTFRCNYRETANVSGCPVTAQLMAIFGNDWTASICESYQLAQGKNEQQIIDDVWHVLFAFDNDDKIIEWAQSKLQLSEQEAKDFAKIKMPQGYAALSLCAIRKIRPWLNDGFRYDEAAMIANLPKVVPENMWKDEQNRKEIIQAVIDVITHYVPNRDIKNDSKFRRVEEVLSNMCFGMAETDQLYQPSKIETYAKALPNKDGIVLLGSPRTDSIKNPMAMRALFRLRALLNQLLKEGKIDCHTKINIEMSRGLNDFNKRRAIEQVQRDNEKKRADYRNEILAYFQAQGINAEPSDDDILKYELWEEQKHKCLYTDKQISLSDFLGSNPLFDIEHTVPRSRGGDNSKANKTLCCRQFNREIKGGKLPQELREKEDILARIESIGWEKEIEDLYTKIARETRAAKAAVEKDRKDKAIQNRHIAKMRLDYLKDKISRFKMKEVPEGFSNRQGVDIGIINRYARLYLQSVFEKVSTIKGETTAEFRKMWGLQDNYSKKQRVNHSHHCIDAITIACIGHKEYDAWAQYNRDEENYYLYGSTKPSFPKPWPTFTEDVKAISDSLVIPHYTANNLLKPTKKKLRIRGVIQRNDEGKPVYVQGNSVRGALHMQTYYGAIIRNEKTVYVVRKDLSFLEKGDIKNIVDDAVREIIESVVNSKGMEALKGVVWMNEEKGIQIKKVRLYASSVTNPIALKRQRFSSKQEHKSNYYVVNDSNYAIGIYEGANEKGVMKRSFKLMNNLEASHASQSGSVLFPELVGNKKLLYILKTGTQVLFYENDKSELWNAGPTELAKRLYKVTGLSISRIQQYEYGLVTFKYNQEARQAKDLKEKKGAWKNNEEFRPVIVMNHNQIKALVEGFDFTISTTGEIRFISND